MTLVIAQRIGGRVSLSSDSRISFGQLGHIDHGVKIFSIPVRIETPTAFETNQSQCVYEHSLGIAVAGSTTNAFTVKDSISEVLQHLQFIPGYTDVSMQGIAKLVYKFYYKTAVDLGAVLREDGLSEIILVGYCPCENRLRVFKFWCEILPVLTPKWDEILSGDQMIFFGSGKAAAENLYTIHPQFSPLQILRQVIEDEHCSSVGGGMQFGDFNDGLDFRICGVQYYKKTEIGGVEYLNTLRGINLYAEGFERDEDGFHIAYNFVTPFDKEIRENLFKALE